MDDPGFDAYKPAQIGALIQTAGVAKAAMPFHRTLTLAMLAGAFIGLGGAAWLAVMVGADPGYGPHRLLGGIVFSLGLILIVVGGGELFTGNAMMVMAAVDRRVTLGALLRNWGIVFAGNLIGTVGFALACDMAGLLDGPSGAIAVSVAEAKLALPPLEAFMRGAMCNALICLAVWMCFAARSVTDKVLAGVWPVSCFVLMGLEHSIANLFLFPSALLAGADLPVSGMAMNLVMVTAGNIIGGAGGVALAYRYAYGGIRP